MPIDPTLAIQLLEQNRKSDTAQRMAPSESFAAGLLGGFQKQMQTKDAEKETRIKLWQDQLKNYDIMVNVTGPDGSITKEPANPQQLDIFLKGIAEGQDPRAGGFSFAPKKQLSVPTMWGTGVNGEPVAVPIPGAAPGSKLPAYTPAQAAAIEQKKVEQRTKAAKEVKKAPGWVKPTEPDTLFADTETYSPADEKTIIDNMKHYGQPRESIIAALKKKGVLK